MFRFQVNGPVTLKIWKPWPQEWGKRAVNRVGGTWDHEANYWLRTRCEIGREGATGDLSTVLKSLMAGRTHLSLSDMKWANWLGETAVAPKKRVPHGDKTPSTRGSAVGWLLWSPPFSGEKLKGRWAADSACSSYKALNTEPWTQVKQPRFHF